MKSFCGSFPPNRRQFRDGHAGVHADRSHPAETIEHLVGVRAQGKHTPPLELKGEGLRPNENRDKAASAEAGIPGDEEAALGALGLPQGGGQTRGPYVPGVPYPYRPTLIFRSRCRRTTRMPRKLPFRSATRC